MPETELRVWKNPFKIPPHRWPVHSWRDVSSTDWHAVPCLHLRLTGHLVGLVRRSHANTSLVQTRNTTTTTTPPPPPPRSTLEVNWQAAVFAGVDQLMKLSIKHVDALREAAGRGQHRGPRLGPTSSAVWIDRFEQRIELLVRVDSPPRTLKPHSSPPQPPSPQEAPPTDDLKTNGIKANRKSDFSMTMLAQHVISWDFHFFFFYILIDFFFQFHHSQILPMCTTANRK